MSSPDKEKNKDNFNFKRQFSESKQSELLEESKKLDTVISNTKHELDSLVLDLRKKILIYKDLEGDKKENEKSNCFYLIKKKKHLENKLNNLYNQQFEIDQSYIKTEYLNDKKEIERIIDEAKQKQKDIKYKSYVKDMADVKSDFKEIKEQQDEFMNALLSFNYNLPEYDEEALDIELENMITEYENNNETFEYDLDDLCRHNDRFLKSKQIGKKNDHDDTSVNN